MEMTPVEKEGHKTVLIYNDLKFDVGIDESFFTPQNMKRIRWYDLIKISLEEHLAQ